MVGTAFGLIGPAIGIGTQLFGDNPGNATQNVPSSLNIPALSVPNQDTWWNNYQGQISNLMNGPNYPAMNYDMFNGQVGNLVNDTFGYIGRAHQGAQEAANMAPGIAGQMQGGANQLYGAANAGVPYMSSILNMGFDPQNQFYDRQSQRLSDQTQAGLAHSGVANSPYGQGVYGQTMGNFNLDWQNQALQRANQGIQGYGALGQGIGSLYGGAANLGAQAMNTTAQGAALPYNFYRGEISDKLGALGQLNNAGMQTYALPQQTIGDISAMMTHTQAMNQLAGQMANQQFGQNQALGQAFGSNIAGLSQGMGNLFGNQNWFGGGSTGWGGNSPGNAGGGGSGFDWGGVPWDTVF